MKTLFKSIIVMFGLLLGSNAYAQTYPAPTYRGMTLFGKTGYCYANNASPITCASTIPLASVPGAAPTASPPFTGTVSILSNTDLSYSFSNIRSVAGTSSVGVNSSLNQILHDSAVITGTNFLNAYTNQCAMDNVLIQGGRNCGFDSLSVTSPTSASNTTRNYVAREMLATATANDNGTLGSEAGALFGINPVALLKSGATNWLNVTAGEADIGMAVGSSAKIKTGFQIVQHVTDAVDASTVNAMLGLSSQNSYGMPDGILFSNFAGNHPIRTGGTLVRTTFAALGAGIDLTAATFSGNAFASPGFFVTGSGGASATGSITINAATVAGLYQTSSSAAADSKIWETFSNSDGTWRLRLLNDAQAAANDAITISRTGYVPTLATFIMPIRTPTIASSGSVPTGTTGACVASSFVGGSTAGTFAAAACAANTIILSGLPAQSNGYACDAWDKTTPANTLKQTASSATSVTFTATTAAADSIVYKCIGY